MSNPHTKAVHLVNNHITEVIKSFKEVGNFMDKSVSARTQAKHDRIAASPEAQRLLDQGFTQSYAERVAKAGK